jgi:hypothetical protein
MRMSGTGCDLHHRKRDVPSQWPEVVTWLISSSKLKRPLAAYGKIASVRRLSSIGITCWT